MADERDVAVRVARALEALGIEYALGGSVASSVQGEPRSTNDIDFAVRLKEEQVGPLAAELGPDFSVDEEGLREAARRGRAENIFYLPDVLKIDLYVRGATEFDRSELARRRRQVLSGSEEIYVATPEDNLLRKLMWFRMGGEVSDRQWRDVLGILRVSRPALDWTYLRDWATRLDVADLLERAENQG